MFGAWTVTDPVAAWELLRDKRIRAAQGNSNPHIEGR
jgi:endonuclease I